MATMNVVSLAIFVFLVFFVSASSYSNIGYDPLEKLLQAKRAKDGAIDMLSWADQRVVYSPAEVNLQDGAMEADKIEKLPGQPNGVDFNQYAGYVTVDAKAGRALFYYFTESPENSSAKPLVLWLNGGPGCSSMGNGAMMELGPFRVNPDGKTLWRNKYSWNNVANIIFLESPAGVGFSYSNTTSDYNLSGDIRTAEDSYIFLINWLERFPQYKSRDFYLAGESYAGHYVPQLAYKILQNNNRTAQTVINLRGIAIGNAWIDDETGEAGMADYLWTHALTSDEIHSGITSNCNFSNLRNVSSQCQVYANLASASIGEVYIYDIYAPLCNSSSTVVLSSGGFDPCSDRYVKSYLNLPEVQEALHANITGLPYPWESCSVSIIEAWRDSPSTVLPVISHLMTNGITVWIYSGDTDGRVPVTSSRYSVNNLRPSVNTKWFPWYTQGEVGGYAVGYGNLLFVTVRGAGHFVPSYQPARAFTLFSSFLEGNLPPSS